MHCLYPVKKIYTILTILLLFLIYYGINLNNAHNWLSVPPSETPLSMIVPSATVNKAAITARLTYNDTGTSQEFDIRYILLWSDPERSPFNQFTEGRTLFERNNCPSRNCYVTSDRNYLDDYTQFEMVAFNGPDLHSLRNTNKLPKRRSPHQKYVYVNIEAAASYPLCSDSWNKYFNWTWTYRLDSDIIWRYFVIRNSSGHVVGPSHTMKWMNYNDMDPISDQLAGTLLRKSKAAAWFVSNCNTMSLREHVVEQIHELMKAFSLRLDIYGDCGKSKCPIYAMEYCLKELERQYYFYFAFENSISDDYVTEKVLHALKHNTVPVVFGGADYKRFLPPGSYLDARELGPRKLAEMMYSIIHDKQMYYSFFKWQKYYSFHAAHETPLTDVYCTLCAGLNGDKYMLSSVYDRLDRWWTPPISCRDQISIKLH